MSMKFFLFINLKMPPIVGILTFMSMKNNISDLSDPEKKMNFLMHVFSCYEHLKFQAQLR